MSLFIFVRCLCCSVGCSLFVACCVLFGNYRLLFVVACWLFVVCCSLLSFGCSSCVARWSLFVVRRWFGLWLVSCLRRMCDCGLPVVVVVVVWRSLFVGLVLLVSMVCYVLFDVCVVCLLFFCCLLLFVGVLLSCVVVCRLVRFF